MRRSTAVVRLTAPEADAKRVQALLAETLDAYGAAVAALEGEGSWTVEAHFVRAPERRQVVELVRAAAGDKAAARVEFTEVAEQEWLATAREALKPVRVGRFSVHGGYDRKAVAPNAISIEIEAALAFGTGHHGTTQGCLRAIQRVIPGRAVRREPGIHIRRGGYGFRAPRFAQPRNDRGRILDLGTGTGVLAIAAARLLRRPVIAGDIDPIAVETARANARFNRVGNLVRVVHAAGTNAPAIRAGAPYDLVLANIVLRPLTALALPIASLLSPRATIVLSGLLPSQANAALAAYGAQGLRLRRREVIEGWVTLTLARSIKRPGERGPPGRQIVRSERGAYFASRVTA